MLVPNPKPKPNPKKEEPDHSPDQDMIPDPGIMTLDQDLTDLNLLVKDKKNRVSMINREHNQEPHTCLPSDALAANSIVVTRTRKP